MKTLIHWISSRFCCVRPDWSYWKQAGAWKER